MKLIKPILFWSMFFVYLAVLLNIILFKFVTPLEFIQGVRGDYYGVNFELFETIRGNWSTVNVWGNVLIFIPLGVYLILLSPRHPIIKTVIRVFLISTLFEMIQLVFHIGACDVDDIFLNTLGGVLGIILFKILELTSSKKEQVRSTVTWISCIIGLPIIFFYGIQWLF